ncbi:MAG: BrnT family toxin [Roseateles sp.]|uniref:BrnT family toxin n=1 Tax=Roseateles sp. TaxID=1971397 RepID=UPI0039E7B802
MRYSFDPGKRATNLTKHGLDLAEAPQVIESGQTVTFEDRRFDYGEERFVTLGPLAGMLVVVVTAETEDHIRIISMRKADRHEQALYRDHLH